MRAIQSPYTGSKGENKHNVISLCKDVKFGSSSLSFLVDLLAFPDVGNKTMRIADNKSDIA
jgi:hypothetical protein